MHNSFLRSSSSSLLVLNILLSTMFERRIEFEEMKGENWLSADHEQLFEEQGWSATPDIYASKLGIDLQSRVLVVCP
jgi:hypothetical protein